MWSKELEKQLREKLQIEVDIVTEKAEKTPDQTIDDIFNYTYAVLPPALCNKKYLKFQ